MTDITGYPLHWPMQHPRTPAHDRKDAQFKRNRRRLTVADGISRIHDELGKFSPGRYYTRVVPDDVIISTNLKLRRHDGLPRSDQKEPDDPGVAVYFELDGVERCLPCDQYARVADNLGAIAATLNALRTIERHGSQLFEMAFTGFTALPGPDHILGRSWRDVLDYHGSDLREAREIYRRRRSETHPDKGGDPRLFDETERAWEQAQEALRP